MRILLLLIIVTCSLLLDAQTVQQTFKDSSYLHYTQGKKWFVSSYRTVGVGFDFFKGGSATIVSAPMGLQINRRLNDNLYAFTGVSMAPAYVSFNRPFSSPGMKSYTGNSYKPGYFGVNPSVNMGLMYVNDAKTFSVSGSIGVQRSRYPMLLYSPANAQRMNSFTPIGVYR